MAGTLGRPCKEPRCPAVVTGNGRYCDKHKANEFSSMRDGNERLAFYGTERWKRLRKLKLAQDPVCEVCTTRFATQVHHLENARDNPLRRFDMTNLQSICIWCHARETQRETQETRNAQRRK